MGYHGCFQETYYSVVLAGESLKPSQVNPQKGPLPELEEQTLWLGPGVYFWYDSEDHAWRWAKQVVARHEKKHPEEKKEPAVIRAEISLGNCLDMLQSKSHDEVRRAYLALVKTYDDYNQKVPSGKKIPYPKNRHTYRLMDDLSDENEAEALLIKNIFRPLDCAVLSQLHRIREKEKLQPYDTIRAAFQEGVPLYPGACIGTEDHVQIAVRNPACIQVLRP